MIRTKYHPFHKRNPKTELLKQNTGLALNVHNYVEHEEEKWLNWKEKKWISLQEQRIGRLQKRNNPRSNKDYILTKQQIVKP